MLAPLLQDTHNFDICRSTRVGTLLLVQFSSPPGGSFAQQLLCLSLGLDCGGHEALVGLRFFGVVADEGHVGLASVVGV